MIVGDLDRSRVGAFRSIHAYHVMYNLEIQGLNLGSGAQIALLIQDINPPSTKEFFFEFFNHFWI